MTQNGRDLGTKFTTLLRPDYFFFLFSLSSLSLSLYIRPAKRDNNSGARRSSRVKTRYSRHDSATSFRENFFRRRCLRPEVGGGRSGFFTSPFTWNNDFVHNKCVWDTYIGKKKRKEIVGSIIFRNFHFFQSRQEFISIRVSRLIFEIDLWIMSIIACDKTYQDSIRIIHF